MLSNETYGHRIKYRVTILKKGIRYTFLMNFSFFLFIYVVVYQSLYCMHKHYNGFPFILFFVIFFLLFCFPMMLKFFACHKNVNELLMQILVKNKCTTHTLTCDFKDNQTYNNYKFPLTRPYQSVWLWVL